MSFRPSYAIAKIIKDMIPIFISDVYETNLLANEMQLNCNYNFFEWHYQLHCFYINNKRFDNSKPDFQILVKIVLKLLHIIICL